MVDVGPYVRRDETDVLALIEADRLPGQPGATAQRLGEALAGRSAVDASWWTELKDIRTDVAREAGRVVGVVSYALRPKDDSGVVLWLHAREQPAVVARLLEHARLMLGSVGQVTAFEFASALSYGMEGLPVRHRPVTHQALVNAGFADADLWRYMFCELAARQSASGSRDAVVESIEHGQAGWKVTVRNSAGALMGEAEFGEPVDGVGVVWWLGVEPPHRGTGMGRRLLEQGLDTLQRVGAREAILFVDDDESGGHRDRRAANRLYDTSGFIEIDRLHSYRLAC